MLVVVVVFAIVIVVAVFSVVVEVVIAVANVTSLQGAWALVKDLRWDILLVQEARTRPGSYPEAEIRRAGWKWLPGPPDANGASLVGAIVKR